MLKMQPAMQNEENEEDEELDLKLISSFAESVRSCEQAD
jgi:hypothetical protein